MEKEQYIPDFLILRLGAFMRSIYSYTNTLLKNEQVTISIDQLPVLAVIAYKGGLCQQQIATILERDKSSVQRTIRYLLNRDLVQITSTERDRRMNYVFITPLGIQHLQRLISRFKKVEERIMEDVSTFEKVITVEMIRRMQKELHKQVLNNLS